MKKRILATLIALCLVIGLGVLAYPKETAISDASEKTAASAPSGIPEDLEYEMQTLEDAAAVPMELATADDASIHTPSKMVIIPEEGKIQHFEQNYFTYNGEEKTRTVDAYLCNTVSVDEDGEYRLHFDICDQNGTDISKFVTWSCDHPEWLSFEDEKAGDAVLHVTPGASGCDVIVVAKFHKDGERDFGVGIGFRIVPPLKDQKVFEGTLPSGGTGLVQNNRILSNETFFQGYGILNYEDDGHFSAKLNFEPTDSASLTSSYPTLVARYPGHHWAKYIDATDPNNVSVTNAYIKGVAVEGPDGQTVRTFLKLGDTMQLTPYTTDDEWTLLKGEDCNVTWSSSDESIATVDEDGKVTGVSEGWVTITATDAYEWADGSTYTGSIILNVQAVEKPYFNEIAFQNENRFMYNDATYATSRKTGMAINKNFYYGSDKIFNSAVWFGPNETPYTVYLNTPNNSATSLGLLETWVNFDDEAFNAELWLNGELVSSLSESGLITNLSPVPGENTVVLKMSFKDPEKTETSEYTFTFYHVAAATNNSGLMSVSNVTTGGVGLEPSGRSLDTVNKFNNQQEGKVFKSTADGKLGGTAGTPADYKNTETNAMISCLYSDVTNFSCTFRATDRIFGPVAYKIGSPDGEIAAEGRGDLPTGEIAFGESDSVVFYVYTMGGQDYDSLKAQGLDPWAEGSSTLKTFKYTVKRLAVKPADLDITADQFSLGETGTVNSVEGTAISGIVNADSEAAMLTVTGLAENTLPYNTTSATAAGNAKTAFEAGEDGVFTKSYAYASAEDPQIKTTYLRLEMTDPEFGKIMGKTYTVTLYKAGTGSADDILPDAVSDYLTIGGIHTNTLGGSNVDKDGASPQATDYASGLGPERTLFGFTPNTFNHRQEDWGFMVNNWTTSERTLISLGNFGGFVTYRFDNAIKNDPANPYGVDFMVYGQPNDGTNPVRNGSVWVSEDGENWYELAGAEHYDELAVWNYSVTYAPGEEKATTSYSDSLGRAGTLRYAEYPKAELYSYPVTDEMTFTGTILTHGEAALDANAVNAAWGYAGLRTAAADSGSASVPNPYTSEEGKGNGFDISWAVDAAGNPVQLSEIHYVRVMAANLIEGTNKDDKGVMVSAIVAAKPNSEDAEPLARSTNAITVGDQTIDLDAAEKEAVVVRLNTAKFDVVVDAAEGANVFINNVNDTTRSYNGDFDYDKAIIRVVVQNGDAPAEIFYVKLDDPMFQRAIDALKSYADPEDYREAEQEELAKAVEDGVAAILNAETAEEIEQALQAAKAAIDAIKTDAEWTAEEEAAKALAEAKESAKEELQKYADPNDFSEAEKALDAAIADGLEKIDAATTPEEVAQALQEAKDAIDAIDKTCPSKDFVDVDRSENSWSHEPIDWAVVSKVTNGIDLTHFGPTYACTRAQAVTFLWRAMGEPEPTATANPFKDVAADAYYYKAVLWAAEKEITNGVTADTFAPDATCTRGQIVTFLWRAEGKVAPKAAATFTDVPADAYFADAVAWAVENGITNGTSPTTFAPNDNCTRAHIVTFLYRDLK